MAFSGFPQAAVQFYNELESDNSKAWWASHKATYDECVRAPFEELIAQLEGRFGEAHLFRPYRDVRFSADKSPYKTHQGAYCPAAAGGGYYVHLDADGLMTAAGAYSMSRDQLARFRASVDADIPGESLVTVLRSSVALGFEIGGDQVPTRPRGVPSDHPRLDLMRRKGLHLVRHHGTPDWLATPEALDRIVADWVAAEPLMVWVAQYIGPADESTERRPSRSR